MESLARSKYWRHTCIPRALPLHQLLASAATPRLGVVSSAGTLPSLRLDGARGWSVTSQSAALASPALLRNRPLEIPLGARWLAVACPAG